MKRNMFDRRPGNRTWVFPVVIVLLVAIPAIVAMTGNPFGPFLAAYVSTALLMYGLIVSIGRFRAHRPIARGWFVLGAGILSGLFVSLATDLGAGIYSGFLVGQALTVGIVLWLTRAVPLGERA